VVAPAIESGRLTEAAAHGAAKLCAREISLYCWCPPRHTWTYAPETPPPVERIGRP